MPHPRAPGGHITIADIRHSLAKALTLVPVRGGDDVDAAVADRGLEIATLLGQHATYDAQLVARADRARCVLWTADEWFWNAAKGAVPRFRWPPEKPRVSPGSAHPPYPSPIRPRLWSWEYREDSRCARRRAPSRWGQVQGGPLSPAPGTPDGTQREARRTVLTSTELAPTRAPLVKRPRTGAESAGNGPAIGPAPGPMLTAREREVLRLVADGHANREIADRLYISPLTAATHVKHLLRKLGLPSRAAAAGWAVRNGFA
ncbi:MAG: hypothetical protein AVDCRST_MAG73-3723 [uncultured Thermomicrobiales bacterium]|uniref:HTH luxR-type domain-containing protein n=1 Tax=uncultured Thermomicrobiales bacterium TaxID=1645740 RepID=A0A6J4UVM8_9BACT|nr:MAG: hypothetical protein AVDCRST_MAG73-3723 [uncultured Thermomicrobiales bacterium]